MKNISEKWRDRVISVAEKTTFSEFVKKNTLVIQHFQNYVKFLAQYLLNISLRVSTRTKGKMKKGG